MERKDGGEVCLSHSRVSDRKIRPPPGHSDHHSIAIFDVRIIRVQWSDNVRLPIRVIALPI